MNYRIYEHIVGLPSHLDTPLETLEEDLKDRTAEEAEEFIQRFVPNVDKYGRKRNVYVYREEK